MNYYSHHLGDYAKDTAHLSMLEHGAYRLLLDRYYATEGGIPADQAHRVARARTRDEKATVDAVLQEFFQLKDGVWINARAEEEIAKFSAKQPEVEKKRENDKERQRRARERRKAMFEQLSSLGIVVPWNATTEEVQAALDAAISQQSSPGSHGVVTQPVTRDNTCTQTPNTINQSKPNSAGVDGTGVTPAGSVCARLKLAGILDVNPSHPRLIALIGAGLSVEEIASIGPEARKKGKGFAWVLATAEGRRRDAAAVPPLPEKGEPPWWSSNERMIAKGQTLGMAPRPGEDWAQFRGRINEAIRVGERAA